MKKGELSDRCPVCGTPVHGRNKTCGARVCRSLMAKFTREVRVIAQGSRTRKGLYGDANPWVAWEARTIAETAEEVAARLFGRQRREDPVTLANRSTD